MFTLSKCIIHVFSSLLKFLAGTVYAAHQLPVFCDPANPAGVLLKSRSGTQPYFLSSSLDRDNRKWQSSQNPAEFTAHPHKVNTDGQRDANLIFRLRNRGQWLLHNILEESQTCGFSCTGFPDGRGSQGFPGRCSVNHHWQQVRCPVGASPESH